LSQKWLRLEKNGFRWGNGARETVNQYSAREMLAPEICRLFTAHLSPYNLKQIGVLHLRQVVIKLRQQDQL